MADKPTATRGRNAHPDERVETWADDSGTWHGKIVFPGSGLEIGELRGTTDRARNKVRRAIDRELRARGEAKEGWRCRVEEAGRSLSPDGSLVRSITWRETFTD